MFSKKKTEVEIVNMKINEDTQVWDWSGDTPHYEEWGEFRRKIRQDIDRCESKIRSLEVENRELTEGLNDLIETALPCKARKFVQRDCFVGYETVCICGIIEEVSPDKATINPKICITCTRRISQ